MSMAQLQAEAAATQTHDLFAALLPDPPGALRCCSEVGWVWVRWMVCRHSRGRQP